MFKLHEDARSIKFLNLDYLFIFGMLTLIAAQTFGLPFLPPFLSLKKSESIQFGANYASSGCGILPETKKYTYVSILSPYLELYHLMVKFRTCTYIYTQGKLMESV